MYESPITRIYEYISRQLVEQEEENYMHMINQTVGYAVNKEELIKALQYDRQQYKKGYEDAMSVIENIKAELHDVIFRYTVSKERQGEGKVEWSDYLLNAEEVFNIIDKHTGGD